MIRSQGLCDYLLVALLFAPAAFGADNTVATDIDAAPAVSVTRGDQVSVFGQPIRIPANTRVIGDVVSIGGRVEIEGEVDGGVVVVMGELEISGQVRQDVAAILSETTVRDAVIDGEVAAVLGSLTLERSRVDGKIVTVLNTFVRDDLSITLPPIEIGSWLPSFWRLLFYLRLASRVAIFGLLILLVALVPDRVRRIGEEARRRYVTAFFVGLLGYIGSAVVLSILSLTIIAIPLAIMVFWILKWIGIAGLFFVVGQSLGRLAGREISVLAAVLVTFSAHTLLTLSPSGFGLAGFVLIAALGLAFFLFVEVPALGLVILTRVGSHPTGTIGRPVVPMVFPPGAGTAPDAP